MKPFVKILSCLILTAMLLPTAAACQDKQQGGEAEQSTSTTTTKKDQGSNTPDKNECKHVPSASGTYCTVCNGVIKKNEGSYSNMVYINVTLTASSGSSGALAVYNSAFKSENCGYLGSTAAVKKDGKKFADTAFSSGEIAYLINTYGARKCFGIADGKTVV